MLSKPLKWICLAIISALIISWLFIRIIASGVNEKIVYRESDFFSYHSLTDNEIENAPRISRDYYFESLPGDGYGPSNSIIFKGVSGIEALQAYLTERGYAKEKRSFGAKEIWSKAEQQNSDLFYLWFDATTGTAELTKVINK